jgi:hypothetical protein
VLVCLQGREACLDDRMGIDPYVPASLFPLNIADSYHSPPDRVVLAASPSGMSLVPGRSWLLRGQHILARHCWAGFDGAECAEKSDTPGVQN